MVYEVLGIIAKSHMRVLLIILDGFGIGKHYPGNAYFRARKPFFKHLFQKYPWISLKASGNAVGIPEGTQGGSEVGHFTMGSGRVTWQTLESINRSIRDGSFFRKKPFLQACRMIRRANQKGKKALHLIGMISDQGVHSHINHLFALLKLANRERAWPVFIHGILDGRDVPEKSAKKFILQIQKKIKELKMDQAISPDGPKKACLASLIGRYYAMDRDMNWKRTEKAYDLYVLGRGKKETDPLRALDRAYGAGIESDYYIEPILFEPNGIVKDGDAVIHWNFRTDRNRQLTWALTSEKPPKETGLRKIGFEPKKKVQPFYVCMGPYSTKAPIAFPTPVIKNNLGETLARSGVKQLRIAETEKYAHVTFFFNSQIEKPFTREKHMLIHSLKTPNYARKPEMSALEITERLTKILDKKTYGFTAVNFANGDLVGHSGDLKATIKAVEVIDCCLAKLVPHAIKNGYDVMITGDHGNVEYMIYDRNPPTGKTPGKIGEPCPSHTTNPVPFLIISRNAKKLKQRTGELKDIAPTILKMLGLSKPKEMTGKSLA